MDKQITRDLINTLQAQRVETVELLANIDALLAQLAPDDKPAAPALPPATAATEPRTPSRPRAKAGKKRGRKPSYSDEAIARIRSGYANGEDPQSIGKAVTPQRTSKAITVRAAMLGLTRMPKTPPIAPQPHAPSQTVQTGPAAVDLAPALMGDPPPGRSATDIG